MVKNFATDLEKGKHYVQIAVCADLLSAQKVSEAFSKLFPINIYGFLKSQKQYYRVLLGPLNKDERGAVLMFFRSQGYKDAFMRMAN